RRHPHGRRRLLRARLDALQRRIPPDHALRQHDRRRGSRGRRSGSRRRGAHVRPDPRRRDRARRAQRRDTFRHTRGRRTPRARGGAGSMTAVVSAGELIARALVREHVTHVFALGGGHIDPTWNAAKAHGITVVDVRHEGAAAHAAEGWALATGEPGVCLVTAGPGFTNALTGIANAHNNGSPVVCIAGAATLRGQDAGEVESLDQLALAQPVTKWARRVYHADRV